MKKLNAVHADSEIRQSAIIHAALSCFIEKGFTDTSIADICHKAKASSGSVYHHFKSKAQLAAAVYLNGIGDYQVGMLAVLEQQISAQEGISAVIAYHLKWVEQHPDWARFLFKQRHAEFMGETKDELHRLNAKFVMGMSAWFRKHTEAGHFKTLPQDIFIALLLGPCQEFTRQYIAGHTVSDMDLAAREIAQGAWDALGL